MLKQTYLNNYPFLKSTVKKAGVIALSSAVIGMAVALFLWLLNEATNYRYSQPWLFILLPIAGIIIHFLYKLWGKSVERGNNLIIEQIHEPGAGVPKRMAPLILVSTVITHLFGGSAGREGTAVQIGGSLANWFADMFHYVDNEKKMLLTTGIAAGFSAVFGTPLAGAVFAIEVLAIGRIKFSFLIPCLFAAFIGNATVTLCGIKHTAYHIDITNTSILNSKLLGGNILLVFKVLLTAIIYGLASFLFVAATRGVKRLADAAIKTDWLMPVAGGIAIIALVFLAGRQDYLGLGVSPQYSGAITIVSAFKQGGAETLSWLWKLIFTATTIGTGFKGGEVTPLFYIGATLGNTLAELLNAPISLFAALGFIAVFAGAANTPLACTLMGAELFGADHIILFAIACFVACQFSGESGIYASQHKHREKPAMRHFKKLSDKMFGA